MITSRFLDSAFAPRPSLIHKLSSKAYQGWQRLRTPQPYILILYYHRILPHIKAFDPLLLQVSTTNFQQHLTYLASYYPVISLEEAARQFHSGELSRKLQIVITFDDGYRDNYLYAYPMLKQAKLPATIFVSTDYVDTQTLFFWEQLQTWIFTVQRDHIEVSGPAPRQYSLKTFGERYAAFYDLQTRLKRLHPRQALDLLAQAAGRAVHHAADDLPLTWKQLRDMAHEGITIGAHTCSHPVLASLSSKEAEIEILRSKQILETGLQQKITTFAYPYGEKGDFTEETVDIVRKHRFHCACSTSFGTNDLNANVFALNRVVVRNWDGPALARKIAHLVKHQEWIVE